MAVIRLFPTQDTYITNNTLLLNNNFGIDEVLLLQKSSIFNPRQYRLSQTQSFQEEVDSRILIQFDLNKVSSQVSGGVIQNPKCFLNLKTLNAVELPLNYNIDIFPVSQSWNMGTGRSAVNVQNGASWKYKDNYSGSYWISGSQPFDKSGGGTYYVGSVFNHLNINTSSFLYNFCNYSSSLQISQSFSYQDSDINVDVTDIVRSWVCGQIPNNGFLITYPTASDGIDYGSLQFYSKDTNTIYSPYLEIKWDDSIYNTGSLNSASLNKVVYANNLGKQYKQNSYSRINVFARELYPLKTFNKFFFGYIDLTYLPKTSYYSILDAESREIIIDFDDNFTKISCDSCGNYFMLNMCGLPQERFFKISFKIIESDGSINFYEDPNYFKVVR